HSHAHTRLRDVSVTSLREHHRVKPAVQIDLLNPPRPDLGNDRAGVQVLARQVGDVARNVDTYDFITEAPQGDHVTARSASNQQHPVGQAQHLAVQA